MIHLPLEGKVASVSDFVSLAHEYQKVAYEAQPRMGFRKTCPRNRVIAINKEGMSSGNMSYAWDWDGCLDSEPRNNNGSRTSVHAVTKSADEMIASSGVLPGKASGSGVAARKKADHAIGINRVVPGGFRRCLSQTPQASGGVRSFSD